jgi:hypothetical protein
MVPLVLSIIVHQGRNRTYAYTKVETFTSTLEICQRFRHIGLSICRTLIIP